MTHKEFQTVSMRALNFIPNMVMLPHFNEAIHATEEHPESFGQTLFSVCLTSESPTELLFFHTFQQGKLMQSEVVGVILIRSY